MDLIWRRALLKKINKIKIISDCILLISLCFFGQVFGSKFALTRASFLLTIIVHLRIIASLGDFGGVDNRGLG